MLADQAHTEHLKRRFISLAETYEAASVEKEGSPQADMALKLLAAAQG